MNDEQSTSGKPVNPASDSHAPRQVAAAANTTVATDAMPAEPPVAVPPPETDVPEVSADIAEQIAADSTTPPVAEPVAAPNPEPSEALADTPQEPAPAENAPATLIERAAAESPAPAPAKIPKSSNPAQTAVTVAVIVMVVLSGLAVFAYITSSK